MASILLRGLFQIVHLNEDELTAEIRLSQSDAEHIEVICSTILNIYGVMLAHCQIVTLRDETTVIVYRLIRDKSQQVKEYHRRIKAFLEKYSLPVE